MMKTASLLFVLYTAVSGSLPADMVTLPSADAGDTSEGEPIAFSTHAVTVQYVYHSSLLEHIPSGSNITGLSFRMDESFGLGHWPGYPEDSAAASENFEIQLSKSLNAPGELSLTFAENIGADVVTVRTGSLDMLHPSDSNDGFSPEILFATSYTYTGGDLLITIRHAGFGSNWNYLPPIDAVSDTPSTPVQTVYTDLGNERAEAEDYGVMPQAPVIRLTVAPRSANLQLTEVMIAPATDTQGPRFSGHLTNGYPFGTARLEAATDLGIFDGWNEVAETTLDGNGEGTFENIADSRPEVLGAPKHFFRVAVDPP